MDMLVSNFCAAFRCAYCFFLNPARKIRPHAPRLQDFSAEKQQSAESQSTTEPLQLGEEKVEEDPMDESRYSNWNVCHEGNDDIIICRLKDPPLFSLQGFTMKTCHIGGGGGDFLSF